MAAADSLALVEEARSKNDHAAALSAALAVWEETRDAVVAEAIDALDREARRTFTAPEDVRTNVDFQKSWMAHLEQRDPTAVGWLAENLFVKLPGSDADGKLDAFVARLRAATELPDPRIASALMTLVEQAAPIVNWASTECRKTLALIGDARTGASIDALVARLDAKDARAWQGVRDKLPKGPTLEAPERERWSVLGGKKQKTSGAASAGDRDALFQAVLDAPDDDQAIAVLADCLQELDDPRGEFIAIQLAEAQGRATLEASKKADALLKKHKKAWLGPLARVTYRATFRRGFLCDLELDGSWKATKKAWSELAECPLLATVESLHGKPTHDIMAGFLTSPAMRSLRTVTIDSELIADAMDERPPETLREVVSSDWKRRDYAKRFVERVLPFLEKTPAIEAVTCGADTVDALMKSKAFARLKRLAVDTIGDRKALELWTRLPRHITSFSWGWASTELRRDTGGVSLHQGVGSWHSDFTTLAKLAAGIKDLRRVEVLGPTKHLNDAKPFEALRKKGIVVDAHEPAFRSGKAAGMSG